MSFFRKIEDKRRAGLKDFDKSRTERHHMRDCDINRLYNRLVGGDMTVVRSGGVYADISEMPQTLQGVLNAQIDARRAFEQLPDNVRRRYPTAEEFYRAVNDENSRKTFEELGLVKTSETPSPVKVEVVNPTTPVPESSGENPSA